MEKSFPLDELIDIDELQSIQDSFARAAGISSVIFSPEGEPLTRLTNPTGFCSLIQSTEKGRERCLRSFMEMGKKALESEKPEIFYCFAHGGHFVTPIMIDGEHKGTMFAGQFIPEKFSPEQLQNLEKIALEIDLDPGLLVKEAEKMRVVEENVIWNYSSLLFLIVGVITRREAQAAELIMAKDALQKAHNGLEKRVQERTSELAEANEVLTQEITERKQAEEMIRESKNLLHTVITATREAMISIGPDGLIRIFNPAAEEMFGRKKEEMVGKPLDPLMPDEYRERHKEDVNSYFATGGPHNAIGKIVELPALHSDGNVFPMEISLSAGKYDNKQFVIAIARDITERKAAEEELKETTEILQSVMDNATDETIVTTDRMGIILNWNEGARRLLGYESEEVVGRESIRIFHTEEYLKSGIMDVNVKKMIATGKPLTEELIYIAKNGRTIPVQEIVNPRFDEDGEFVGMVGMARDITERKAAEEEIKKKTEELKGFNKLAVGRELKMIELKKEINALLGKLGEEPGYKIVGDV